MSCIDLNTDLSSLSLGNLPNVPLCSGVYKMANILSINQLNEKKFIGQKDNSNQPLTTIALLFSVSVTTNPDGICQITISENHFPALYRDDIACLMQRTEIREFSNFSIVSQGMLDGKYYYQTSNTWVYDYTKVGSLLVVYTTFNSLKFFVEEKSIVNGIKSVRLRSSSPANISGAANQYVKLCIYNPNINDSDIEEDHYIFTVDASGHETIIRYRKPTGMTVLPSFFVSTGDTLLNISSSSNISFQNIRFIGNTINDPTRCQDQADVLAPSAIHIGRGCLNITFQNCVFEHLHGYCIGVGDTEKDSRPTLGDGIAVADGDCDCEGISITGCTFQHIHGGAVHLNNCQNSTVSGNTITDYGKLLASSCAILMRSGFGVQMTGNTISDGYYTGISVGWDWQYTRVGQCHDNTIANNNITNVLSSDTFVDENDEVCSGILMYDGGGIYTLGISHGTVIHHNVIHDVCQGHKAEFFRSFIGPHDMRWNLSAIYLDEASSFIKVYENIVYNNPVNIHINHGNGLELFDNLFAYPTICNLTANYNYRHFPSRIINNEEVEHPYTTGPLDKVIVEDLVFFSYRNIYIQEEGRVFHLPYREECYFTGDLFDVYGNGVHRGSLTDIINDATRADGCFENTIHNVLFNYSTETGQWELRDNLVNAPTAYYESHARQYYLNNEEMRRIRVSCPYWYDKLCFLVVVRQKTTLTMETSFKYLQGFQGLNANIPEEDWLSPLHSGNSICLQPNTEYIIRVKNYYDGYVTFGDITQLKVFDVTIVRQIQEFHTSGDYFEYAYLSCHDLHKLRYVEQLQVRYGLRDLSDRHLVSLAQFKSLGLLLLGGANIYTETEHYAGTADWHIKRLFIPDGIMAQLALLNIGVEYVPHNLGSLRNCVSLSLFGSPVWKYLADKVVETVDPLTEDTVLSFRDEYKPLPISQVYLSANAYFEEYVYLKDMFLAACQQAAE